MKQAKCLLTLFLFLFAAQAKANHNSGGELRYSFDGNKYNFRVIMYSECNSVGLQDSVNLYYQSTSLGVSSQIKIPGVSTELVAMPCPGAANKCTNPSSNLPGYAKHVYEGSIPASAIAAAPDWVFFVNECCRGLNVNLGASQSMHLEATLNNANGANNSAYVPTIAPAYMPFNSTAYIPVQLLDPDGDSLVIVPSAPKASVFGGIVYAPGYSGSMPLGTNGFYGINQSTGVMTIKTPNMTGSFTLAFTVYEYRNGVQIGSFLREFKLASLPASGTVKYSYPFQQSPIQVAYACPGAAGSASASFIDSVSTDSVTVVVDTPALPGWNFNITTTNSSPTGSANITWTAPASLNPATLPYFYIKLKVYDNACPRGNTEYAILVKTQQCPTDSVWPGDANSDNVANLVDVLAVAVAYGQTGPVRPGANISWTPQWAQDWANNYPFTTTNVKHGDCNGDGVINISDLGAIAANFGLAHPKGSPRQKTSGAPDLYFDVANIVAAPGKTVVVPINLGNAAASLNGVYGLSASVIVDGVTLSTPATLGTNTSWLGDNTNTLMFSKEFTNNTILWAYARTNHKNTAGNGTIATLTFTIPNSTPVGSRIKLDMDDVRIIDNNGRPVAMPYNVLSSEMTIVPSGISAANNVLQAASVIPNPSYNNAQLHVQLAQNDKIQVQVADVTGKVVFAATETLQAGSHVITLPPNTARGLYTIQLTTTMGAPHTLKWVKY